MKLAGISKIRNEAAIIQDTLDHYEQICDAGIYLVDELSTDDTVKIALQHPAVKKVHELSFVNPNRMQAEFLNRKLALEMAQVDNPDWILVFDADERVDFDFKGFEGCDAIRMKFFDYYITDEDRDKPYHQRRWIGPEYRQIVNFVRNTPAVNFLYLDQREPCYSGALLNSGYVKHYGKAISVDEWEKTCQYYCEWPEPYKSKWEKRKGKAVHDKSDFGAPLIEWHEKESKGFLLCQ